MFERFTAEARSAVVGAQEHAARRGDPAITVTHLLLALTEGSLSGLLSAYGIDAETIERLAPGRTARAIDDSDALRTIGVDLDAIRRSIEAAFGSGALEAASSRRRRVRMRRRDRGHRAFSASAKLALELSLRETIRLPGRQIGAESLLLGLLGSDDPELAHLMRQVPADLADLRLHVESRIRDAA